jgi:glycosyltransferase involved in cell wall biosynthesis
MRVAMVIQSFDPEIGGAQRQLEAVAPLLAERGVECLCITRRRGGAPLRERRLGLEVRRIRVPRARGLASAAYTAGGLAELVRFRPDVIHTYDLLSPSTIGLIGSRLLGAPVITKVLATGPDGDLSLLLRKRLGRRRLAAITSRFSAFIAQAGAVEGELAEWGVTPDRIWPIANGVDTARFRPSGAAERGELTSALGLAGPGPVSLYCGRFVESKRLEVLLEAFRELPGHLVLVGEGPRRERIAELARHDALRGRVHLLDPVADPASIYRVADLYVSASSTEGMSNSVAEAMASGVPVAASPASGMEELLGPEGGIVAAGGSANELRAAAAALLSDAERRAACSAAARRRMVERHSLDATADALCELYAHVRGHAVPASAIAAAEGAPA